MESLGFKIHPEKSVSFPVQELIFLGFNLDSRSLQISLTVEKEDKLIRAARDVLSKQLVSIREMAGLIGLTISFAQAFKFGGRHTKQLEIEKVQALAQARGNFDAKMVVSEKAKEDILWWISNVKSSGKEILETDPEIVLFTDASNEGWGAHVEDTATGGRWSDDEKPSHINVLELRAIDFALRSLCDREGTHIKVFTDNMTALAYIKHQGGVKSPDCNKVAQDIWAWCEDRDVWLSIAHIPGLENELADYKSRHFADNLEWSLKPEIFSRIVKVFGKPEIDLFATRLNCKVDCFVSWKPDPQAFAVDAFSLSWTDKFFYAFPPFSCVGRVLQKILQEGASGILVVPWWPGQPWWGRLINRATRKLHFRSKKGNLLAQGTPENAQFIHRCPLGVFRF